MKVVAFIKQSPKAYSIENMHSKTPQALTVPPKNASGKDTGQFEILRSNQFTYNIQVCQDSETWELNFPLVQKAKMLSVFNDKHVATWTSAAPQTIGIAHITVLSGLNNHTECTEFHYARASLIFLGK